MVKNGDMAKIATTNNMALRLAKFCILLMSVKNVATLRWNALKMII